jgi:hypothetical protein
MKQAPVVSFIILSGIIIGPEWFFRHFIRRSVNRTSHRYPIPGSSTPVSIYGYICISKYGIVLAGSRGPVNSDRPVHCMGSGNSTIRYNVMSLPAFRGP